MSSELTSNDLDLMNVSVTCVTQFTSSFAKRYWQVSSIAAKRRLEKLERKGLLRSRSVLAATPPPIHGPLCVFKPEQEIPHTAGRVSYQARQRWKSIPVVVNRVYFATDLGRGLLGRPPIKPPRDIQATHDLGLSDVYLAYRQRWPKLTARCWLNESEYAHHRGHCVKVEDAMLCRNHQVLLMVDYAGAYRPDRVKDLMCHAQEHNVPIAIY
ncbi:hypothetical protein [Bythopirellula goksoeyrii]|uniref:Uncharacterized protein n=1 Tax=Bythopirellula goksoeyrii TaxID=1400387 RepID=A0A5B9QIB1_9BACT|nr:hypothetical protein [Bythopirellula goksoeyrii]QEG37719.1 hypothetical protein Pr1d_50650 [Bythopirellula goksoeyrii]